MGKRTSTWTESRRQRWGHELTVVEEATIADVQQWSLGHVVERIGFGNFVEKGRRKERNCEYGERLERNLGKK